MLPIPDPFLFSNLFGVINVRWYGVVIVLGALAGAWLSSKEAARRGENPSAVWDALFIALILGLLGARLYHVVSSPAAGVVTFQYYLDNPWINVSLAGLTFPFPRVLAIWEGGLGIFGGILGGLLGVLLFVRWNKLNPLRWLDIGAVGLLLGQAIGRWGNYFNQELYGNPTTAPWGIPIDEAHRLPQFQALSDLTLFHPTFLYESLLCLVGVGALLFIGRRWRDQLLDGDLASIYLIIYALIRFFTEFQRPDAWLFAGVPVAQIVSSVLLVGALAVMVIRRQVLHQQPVPQPAESEPVIEAPVSSSPVRRKRRSKPRQ
ncbi:MAG: prolipoprotein diacylglyceryl transferase [Chloroflexi bacterium]|nr:prolipoprotein diacylglyceryl transferase [Chloroflexota bacterium]